MSRQKYALITGASEGIGKAFAFEFAGRGHNLMLVARNQEKLKKVAKEIKKTASVSVTIYAFDLSQPTSVDQLMKNIRKSRLTIDFLVNNAGFGDLANVTKADTGKLKNMINLNITCLTELCQAVAQQMIKKKSGGRIINVASIAAFIPGPHMAVYYATKAYVLSFSQALAYELKDSNITVTALCPGPTKTSFADAANAKNSALFRSNLPTADDIARFGYKGMQKGKLVATWGAGNQITSRFVSLLPRKLMLEFVARRHPLSNGKPV